MVTSISFQQLDMRDGKEKLRDGWRMVRFGDVVRNVQVNVDPQESGLERYVAGEHMETDNLHIKQWGTIGDGYLGPAFHRKFVKGQVLYGSRRTYLRKVAVAEFDGICANTTFTLESNRDELLQDLLPFIMQTETFTEHSIKQSRGSVNPYINWKDIAWYEFALPPKDEQRRIADILWAADEAIQKFEICSWILAKLQQSYFETWFSHDVKSTNWPNVSLNEVCSIQNGQIDPTISPYSEMIHIAPDDIESQTGNILEKKTASEDGVASGNYEFSETAILYSKIRPNLQKVVSPKFSGICSADIYPIYPKPNVLSEFLFRLLLSEDFTSYAVTNSVRSAIPKINRQALLQYRFKLPPLSEQRKFSKVSAFFNSNYNVLQRYITSYKNLKRSLLTHLLLVQ